MQILILYYSRSGNTRKLAEAITQGVNEVEGVDALLKSTSEVSRDDFGASDGIIAGSPVYFGTMAAELKKVFDDFLPIRRKMEDKPGAAFATSADASGGKETTIISIIQAMLIYGMIIVGDPMDATGHYGTSCVGSPDEKTIENARKHGKRVAEMAKSLRE
ncbi:NAD(P)H-dependent oxidoreductase [candidate division WOR-3 bacterium]|nr:NAD(P)H-dependent oxidoreductase [candidate division WOR-3 bacterium]